MSIASASVYCLMVSIGPGRTTSRSAGFVTDGGGVHWVGWVGGVAATPSIRGVPRTQALAATSDASAKRARRRPSPGRLTVSWPDLPAPQAAEPRGEYWRQAGASAESTDDPSRSHRA